jgi:SAM-dependent methyltransferase
MKRDSTSTRLRYFYASQDAGIYDHTVRMTDRAYDLIHNVTARTLDFWLSQRATKHSIDSPVWILDVGCGTGTEAIQVLTKSPYYHIVCIDSSREMLDEFREKARRAFGNSSANGRLVFAEMDFRERGWLDSSIAELAPGRSPNNFAAAMSVYALHHLLPDEKREVYRAIYQRLEVDSVFINSDLYAFSTPWLSELAQAEEESWIEQEFGISISQSDSMSAIRGANGIRLRDAWLDHVRTENRPLPITSKKSAEISESVSEEHLLCEVGYARVEVPARHYQSAVLVAVK